CVQGMLAHSALQIGDANAYERNCRALVELCRQHNCVEYDLLRVCLLSPSAVDDANELVALTKDAASRGNPSLRKRANVGGALYRAGQFAEAATVLRGVDHANGLVLLSRMGTPEIVLADNARVAAFLALTYAKLGDSSGAKTWLARARKW